MGNKIYVVIGIVEEDDNNWVKYEEHNVYVGTDGEYAYGETISKPEFTDYDELRSEEWVSGKKIRELLYNDSRNCWTVTFDLYADLMAELEVLDARREEIRAIIENGGN